MNAVQVLLKDHKEIRELFGQFEEAGERAYKTKQALAEKVIEELTAHSKMEERIFYPAVREKAGKETQALVLEGIEEHRVADFLMERLQKTGPEEETFDAKFTVLIESVKHHINEEERELFPESRKVLAGDLDRLGEQMEALHHKLEG
jgi:hemerythrin-like domain-containing protein